MYHVAVVVLDMVVDQVTIFVMVVLLLVMMVM
jgi:hypothetical protein